MLELLWFRSKEQLLRTPPVLLNLATKTIPLIPPHPNSSNVALVQPLQIKSSSLFRLRIFVYYHYKLIFY